MKKLLLGMMAFFCLCSCSTNKVVYERECKFVCINENKTYKDMQYDACLCETKAAKDIKK